jgi:hypothetical protein
MPLDSFLTLLGIDYVTLPSDLRQRLFASDGHVLGTVAEVQFGGVENDRGEVRWTLAPTSHVRPRAFVAQRWRFSSSAEALESIVSGAHAAGEVVLTGAGVPGGAANAPNPLPCSVETYSPEVVGFTCNSPLAGYAVLADELAEGWTATVDGKPVEIVRADMLFRAVAISPGSHQIVMRYRTPWLRTGVAISLVAWLAWVLLWRRALFVA